MSDDKSKFEGLPPESGSPDMPDGLAPTPVRSNAEGDIPALPSSSRPELGVVPVPASIEAA